MVHRSRAVSSPIRSMKARGETSQKIGFLNPPRYTECGERTDSHSSVK
jgi:hypothetical protein